MVAVASFAAVVVVAVGVEAVAAAVGGAESVVALVGVSVVGMAGPVCLPGFAASRAAVGPRGTMSLAVLALGSEVQGDDELVVERVGEGVVVRVESRKAGEEADSGTLEKRALLPSFHLDRSVGLVQRQ